MGIMSWDLEGGFNTSLPVCYPHLTIRREYTVNSKSECPSTDNSASEICPIQPCPRPNGDPILRS